MPDDRTVLDHLLEGRDALVLEVKRLSTAIDELDAVIGQIGGGHRRLGNADTTPNGSSTSAPNGTSDSAPEPVDDPQIDSPVEVEPARPVTRRARPRKAAARKSARKSTARPAEAPKSIRVHVLEMLAAEDREFGLAEIIDRIHDEGIQAHDDAVRSITIKLMKDGRVERVGRGQYKLARRGGNARHAATDAATNTTAASTPVRDETASAPTEDVPEAADAQEPRPAQQPPSQPGSFTPPLNLGQPWDRP